MEVIRNRIEWEAHTSVHQHQTLTHTGLTNFSVGSRTAVSSADEDAMPVTGYFGFTRVKAMRKILK